MAGFDAAWFEAMVAATEAEPARFRALGFANANIEFRSVASNGVHRFGLVLDGFDVETTGELGDGSSFNADVVVGASADTWQDMVNNIVANGSADRLHTLNALSIAGLPIELSAEDPMGRDKFFRYAETLQELFDAAGQLVREPAG